MTIMAIESRVVLDDILFWWLEKMRVDGCLHKMLYLTVLGMFDLLRLTIIITCNIIIFIIIAVVKTMPLSAMRISFTFLYVVHNPILMVWLLFGCMLFTNNQISQVCLMKNTPNSENDIPIFQPVGPWIGYSFADLWTAGCRRSLNALFRVDTMSAG